jgi:hypothetical protein
MSVTSQQKRKLHVFPLKYERVRGVATRGAPDRVSEVSSDTREAEGADLKSKINGSATCTLAGRSAHALKQ